MPVSTFRIVMLTPGTMAPVESVTVPRIVAVVTCADIGLNPAINHSRIAPSSLLDTVIKASSDTPREKARHRLSNPAAERRKHPSGRNYTWAELMKRVGPWMCWNARNASHTTYALHDTPTQI